MHIGIITSSLGDRGTQVECADGMTNPTNGALNAHANDQGHLVNRGGADEAPRGQPPSGAKVSIACLEQANVVAGDGGT
jgi:hypothetical protein